MVVVKFDEMFDNGMRGWGFDFRNSQLYRYDKYMLLLQKNNISSKVKNNILDIACWDGFFAANYLRKIFKQKIVGVDIAEVAIEYAKKKYMDIEFIVDRLPELKLIKESYDFVVLNECLYYLSEKDKRKSIENVYELCNDGGYILISVNIGEGYFTVENLREIVMEKFQIVDEETMYIKRYYKYIETPVVMLLSLAQRTCWEKRKINTLRRKLVNLVFNNFFARNFYNKGIVIVCKMLLRNMPIKMIDFLGSQLKSEKDLSVYMILGKKRIADSQNNESH